MDNLPIPISLFDRASQVKKNLEGLDDNDTGVVLIGENGRPVTVDFNVIGHLLVIGSTVTNKDFIFDAILQSIFWRYTAEDVRLIITDFQSDLSEYREPNPHLLTEMIGEPDKTLTALRWTIMELDNRFKEMKKAKARSLNFYNQKAKEKKPLIIFIIKNIDHLMSFAPKDAEQYIYDIVSRGAKAGIHMVIVTDKLSRSNVPSGIASNMPNRVIFKLSNEEDSLTTGVEGADKLGRDEFILKLAYDKPVKARNLPITHGDINAVQDYFKKHFSAVKYGEDTILVGQSSLDGSEKDPLFDQSLKIINEYESASASLLQRRLSIGYARAARLLDQLEASGYVGPAEGSAPRKVLKK